jgi:hypothetical protein
MTGTLAASAISANVVSSASAIHGSGSWHLPHRGVPAAAAGTRLAWPQCAQWVSPLAMALLSRTGPRVSWPPSRGSMEDRGSVQPGGQAKAAMMAALPARPHRTPP